MRWQGEKDNEVDFDRKKIHQKTWPRFLSAPPFTPFPADAADAAPIAANGHKVKQQHLLGAGKGAPPPLIKVPFRFRREVILKSENSCYYLADHLKVVLPPPPPPTDHHH